MAGDKAVGAGFGFADRTFRSVDEKKPEKKTSPNQRQS
jgi:hypothetical protein